VKSTVTLRDRSDIGSFRTRGNDQGGCGIGDKVIHFGGGIGTIERLEDGTGLQHRKIKKHGRQSLLQLRRHPIPWFHAQGFQRIGEAGDR
jgi:hypothetical protein